MSSIPSPAPWLEKAALSRHRDWCGLVPRALPSWALPGVMFARILVVLDDAKIRLDMQAAHRAPLQRDDVVHDMQAPSGPRHDFRLEVNCEDGILVRPERAALLATLLRDGQARADRRAVTLTVALKALQRRRRVSLLPRFARRAVLFTVDGGTRALTGEHPRRIALFPGPRLLDVDLTVVFVVGFAERLHAFSVAQCPGFRVFHVPLGRTRLEPVL